MSGGGILLTITDRFLLTQSKEFNLKPNEEVRVDLKLEKKPHQPETKITGRVTHDGIPVPNATVKVLDQKFNPVIHTITDKDGIYVIKNLNTGIYKLTATATGFLVANTINFVLKEKEIKTINVEIKKDKTFETGFIYGKVTEFITKKIIKNAEINLFDSCSENLIVKTTSNEFGQYLLCGISSGEYCAVASKQGFLNSIPVLITFSERQFIKVDFQLQINALTSSGTVSGIISDRFFKVIAGGCVGLFRVDNGSEILVQVKITNSEGLYLFTDVQPGEYVVKAKMQENWDVCKTVRLL